MGVNMGLLPTKGLTLPLISSGGSSVRMTCAAVGLLLRVSCELDRAERRHAARVRGDAPRTDGDGEIEPANTIRPPVATTRQVPAPLTAVVPVSRGGGRGRIEPRFGAQR
jgi:cell division protein FtsW